MEDGTRAERRLVGCRRANDIYPVGPARLRHAVGLGTPSCQVDAGVLDGGRTVDDFRSRCKLHTRSSGWVGILGKTRLWRLWCGARHTANPLTPGQARGDDCARINGVTDKGLLGEALIECPWTPTDPGLASASQSRRLSGSPMLRDESEALEIRQGCALEGRSALIRRIVVKGLCLFQQRQFNVHGRLPVTMKCHAFVACGPFP